MPGTRPGMTLRIGLTTVQTCSRQIHARIKQLLRIAGQNLLVILAEQI
jgi:hypothetical protein